MRKAVTGIRAWLLQRVTAAFMLLFIVFVLSHLLLDRPRLFLSASANDGGKEASTGCSRPACPSQATAGVDATTCSAWRPSSTDYRVRRAPTSPQADSASRDVNYGSEQIVETCYAWHANRCEIISADYQHRVHPAYNRDRGPSRSIRCGFICRAETESNAASSRNHSSQYAILQYPLMKQAGCRVNPGE